MLIPSQQRLGNQSPTTHHPVIRGELKEQYIIARTDFDILYYTTYCRRLNSAWFLYGVFIVVWPPGPD